MVYLTPSISEIPTLRSLRDTDLEIWLDQEIHFIYRWPNHEHYDHNTDERFGETGHVWSLQGDQPKKTAEKKTRKECVSVFLTGSAFISFCEMIFNFSQK